jgi:uncharacterized Tic20 family protein
MTEVIDVQNQEIERNWAMLSHLLGLIPIPFVHVLGPLLVWLLKKDSSSFVGTHAKEAINFQITIVIALVVSGWLCLFVIGFLCLIAVFVTDLILVITAASKAKRGESFHYPLSLRFF